MKFTVTSIAALIALVQAIEITNEELNPVAGQPFEITWQNAEGPVTINLRYGDPNNLQLAGQIVANVDGDAGTYTWEVPEDLVPRTNYAIQVVDPVDDNYSIPFPLEGTGEEETTTSAPTSTATSTVTSTSTEASTTSESVSSSASTDEPSSTESESATSTESESASQTSEDSESTDVPDSKAGRLGSPVALIFTLAAMLYFH